MLCSQLTIMYVYYVIPVCVLILTGNPPSVFNHVVPVIVSEDFIWQSIESHSVEYIYSQNIRVSFKGMQKNEFLLRYGTYYVTRT
jgi:hypothetical protein